MTNERFNELKAAYSSGLPETLVMNHYDLSANFVDTTTEEWRAFLTEPEIEQWVTSELSLLQASELNKLIAGINTSNSMGKAQIINSLAKLGESKQTKEGPVFIYTFVPLNKHEQEAPNVTAPLNINIFDK